MNFHIITIFPEIFNSYFNESILGRAQKNKIIKIKTHDLRKWTSDKHKTVDDTPYGGGAGMVMKVEPLYRAVSSIMYNVLRNKKKHNTKYLIHNTKTVLLSAKGKKWNQQLAKKYSKLDNIILICGRYEGVDERVKKFVDDEISIGDYVLTGGEIPAMAIVDSITRLLPGALGNAESAETESHSKPGILEYPQYTRPEVFEAAPLQKPASTERMRGERGRGVKKNPKSEIRHPKSELRVPKILLSGNHKLIEEWREKNMKKK